MGYTIFVHPQVVPKMIQVRVEDEPLYFPPVYKYPDGQDPADGGVGSFGELVTPERYEPQSHMEDQLNPIPPAVYPASFGERIWYCRSMDHYSDDPKLRAELWEDPEGTATYPEILATFPELPRYVEIAARKWGSAQLDKLVSPYLGVERETWHVQQREAEAWQADPAANVPMITALAAARGITVADLVSKIMENVNAFRVASGVILGKQQALIDQGYQASELATLLAITDEVGIKLMEV